MKRVCIRVFQLGLLVALTIVVTPRRAAANEIACFAICVYDDWQCILQTGHPADSCSYDKGNDLCNLGGCALGPYAAS